MSDTVSRSWFAVFNNPEQHGYSGTPEAIIEQMKNEWIGDNSLRKGYWTYCISDKGLPHIHMVLEGSGSMRFSAVKKAYPKAIHLSPTKGNKKQVLSYIKKEPPYNEKGEQVICSTSFGNIEGYKRFALSNTNETLYAIEQLIEDGLAPSQIMEQDIKFRKEESIIRKAYFAKRYKETPPHRNVKVYWHLGSSGSGKSYEYVKLCEHEDDNIYLFNDYANKGVGGFDSYCGEPILFIDELKGKSLPFELLLTIMQGYRSQIHCRFANCYALWNEVHITSIYAPEDIYSDLVDRADRDKDPIKQLLRRITKYVYHYKLDDEYRTFELDGKLYTNYSELKKLVAEAIKEERANE